MGATPSPGSHTTPHSACQRCGARLRRDHHGELCEACSARQGGSVPLLDAEFFTREPVRRALAGYDFAFLFRAVRRHAELTQRALGELLDLDQDRISRIERGERPLRDVAVVARVVSRLDIPPALLGFGQAAVSVQSAGASSDGREVDWVQRRDFLRVVAGITLGLGAGSLDLDRLDALMPADIAATPTRIGVADVEAIEESTALFRCWDFSRGGGLSRPMALTQLRSVLPLLKTACAPAVRERLLLATADLGLVSAWMSYDVERHNDARRMWMVALSVLEESTHARATDLVVDLLLDMAHQALHLHRTQEALRLVQLGYATAASRSQPISAYTASYLASNQAWCHAAQGDAGACERALGRSVEQFAVADPGKAAPWAAHVDAAELSAQQGHAYYTLALASADPRHAVRAIPFLQHAVDGYESAYTRSRAVNLPGLAGAHVLAGNLDAASQIGNQAVAEITALASPRAYDRLRTLDTVLQPHALDSAAGELRGRIHAALAVA